MIIISFLCHKVEIWALGEGRISLWRSEEAKDSQMGVYYEHSLAPQLTNYRSCLIAFSEMKSEVEEAKSRRGGNGAQNKLRLITNSIIIHV